MKKPPGIPSGRLNIKLLNSFKLHSAGKPGEHKLERQQDCASHQRKHIENHCGAQHFAVASHADIEVPPQHSRKDSAGTQRSPQHNCQPVPCSQGEAYHLSADDLDGHAQDHEHIRGAGVGQPCAKAVVILRDKRYRYQQRGNAQI